jgi:hypothetical protein
LSSNPILALAALAVVLAATPAQARDGIACPERCAPRLRECLQDGRPVLRACLVDCREGSDCPQGIEPEDCTDGGDLHACVGACREARRTEIRACVRASIECAARCRPPVPGPTPTATPGP